MNNRQLAYLSELDIDAYRPRIVVAEAESASPEAIIHGDDASVLSAHHSSAELSVSADNLESQAPATELPSESVDYLADSKNGGVPVAVDSGIEVGSNETSEWEKLRAEVAQCTKCQLCESRTQTVFGVGSMATDILFIGEAPGAEEDRRGEPFVGKAGKLLDNMLQSIGLDRNTAFIANILKCRPPENRDPSAGEAAECIGYLERQIKLIAPKVIVVLGRVAAQNLLKLDANMSQIRGKRYFFGATQIPVVATYHPAYLLRSPSQKKVAWQDFVTVSKLLKKVG